MLGTRMVLTQDSDLVQEYLRILNMLSALGVKTNLIVPKYVSGRSVITGLALARTLLDLYPIIMGSELGRGLQSIFFEPFLTFLVLDISRPELGKVSITVKPEYWVTLESFARALQQGQMGYYAEIVLVPSEEYKRVLIEALRELARRYAPKYVSEDTASYLQPKFPYLYYKGELKLPISPVRVEPLYEKFAEEAKKLAVQKLLERGQSIIELTKLIIERARQKLMQYLTSIQQ